jgi:deoxyribonuclease-4
LDRLLFGTAGTPLSSKARSSISGIKRIAELGLGCMELEFVRGVKMGEATAKEVSRAAAKSGIKLSVHAPYYINLNSSVDETLKASIKRLVDSARIGSICGARTIVFHPGFYMKSSKSATFKIIKRMLVKIHGELHSNGIDVLLRPETTGKLSQFGSLEEILGLSSMVEGVEPCVDFSHLHARDGRINSAEEFRDILINFEETLGTASLKNMHIHLSGIEYTRKGEKRHLNLNESDLKYLDLLKTWREFNLGGFVICESPNLEGDAMQLKDAYKDL